MGSKYEVKGWVSDGRGDYEWVELYRGQSFVRALWATWRGRANGAGCVRLEWR